MDAYFDGPREARRFTEFVYAPIPRGVPRFTGGKEAARRVAEACGARGPRMLASFAGPLALSLANLPDRFVIKPNNIASRHGVFLMSRRSDTEWFDAFSQKSWTEDAIRREIAEQLSQRGREPDTPVLVEEWVAGENGAEQIPFDYKLFTFDGSVELIAQIDRNHGRSRFSFFQRDFEPLPDHLITLGRFIDKGERRRPANWQDMLDVARRVSEHLDLPFIRVDLYTTGTEVIVGEFTPQPGGALVGQYRLADTLDGELGAYWRMALKRRGFGAPRVKGLPPVLEDERNFRRGGPIGWYLGRLRRRLARRKKARLAAGKAG